MQEIRKSKFCMTRAKASDARSQKIKIMHDKGKGKCCIKSIESIENAESHN